MQWGSFHESPIVAYDEKDWTAGNRDSIPHVCNRLALSRLRHRSIVGMREKTAGDFFAGDSRDDRLTHSLCSAGCYIFYDSVQKGFGARRTANWIAELSNRGIIKDVLARIYLSYLRQGSIAVVLRASRFLIRCCAARFDASISSNRKLRVIQFPSFFMHHEVCIGHSYVTELPWRNKIFCSAAGRL